MSFRYTRTAWNMEEFFRDAFKGLCLIYTVREYVFGVVYTHGNSMEPSILSGDVLLSEQVLPRLYPERLNRGDLVNYKKPDSNGITVMKRIKGIPGDKIPCATDELGNFDMNGLFRRILIVPPGHFWMEGDNSATSVDSRIYGPIPMALVQARNFAIIWPPQRAKFIPKSK